MGKGWAKGLKEMTVTRTVGDNVAHIQYRPKHSPVITQLTTNKPVKLTDDAVKSWLYEHPEEKVIAGTKAFKNFNAPAGMKVGNAKFTANGITYHFENGEIKGITKGGKSKKNAM